MSTGETGSRMVVAEELPEILKEIQAAIDANTSESEIRISRLAIMQPQSPEITGQQMGYKPGMLVDSITREVLTDLGLPPWLLQKGVPEADLKPMHFALIVPVFKLPTEYIKWVKRNERKEGMDRWEFKTLDKNDPRVKAGVWKSLGGTFGLKPEDKGKAPPVTDNCNYLCLVIDPKTGKPKTNFLVATFSRTSAEAGKQLATALAANKMQGLMPWGCTFWLYTEARQYMQPGEPKPTTAYVMRVTRGPESGSIVFSNAQTEILMMARALSAPASGVLLQTAFINSADLDAAEHEDDGSGSGGNPQQTIDENPFQDPGVVEPEKTF